MKLLEIANCYVCPFWSAGNSTHHKDNGSCGGFIINGQHSCKSLWGVDINETPEWCPLIDSEDYINSKEAGGEE